MSSATNTPSGFWNRAGLQDVDKEACVQAVRDRYRGHVVEEFGEQGYCSFTLLVSAPTKVRHSQHGDEAKIIKDVGSEKGHSFIVQLRSVQHALDPNIVHAASEAHPSLAPTVRILDLPLPGNLRAYEMERVRGTPSSRVQPRTRTLEINTCEKVERLVATFADFIAQGWKTASWTKSESRHARADSPMSDTSNTLPQCTGKVGSSIVYRLQKLSTELPDDRLRKRAGLTLDLVRHMSDYPIVLNHGDLIPSNILVDDATWETTGLVDWAEAEYLPFGTCLYGLELLLGYLKPITQAPTMHSDDPSYSHREVTFVYYDNAQQLRDLFQVRLLDAVPEMREKKHQVEVIRDMGVLLWFGIAWDDGAIDRTVNEADDAEEMACLRAFLSTSCM